LHDRIAVAEIKEIGAGKFKITELNNGQPIIDVGKKNDFDSGFVLVPASVIFNGNVWLYYTAVGLGTDSIGLAVSEDGVNFRKVGKVLEGRGPDAVVLDEKVHLIFH